MLICFFSRVMEEALAETVTDALEIPPPPAEPCIEPPNEPVEAEPAKGKHFKIKTKINIINII